MSDLALASLLATTILIASMVSVEVALSAALLELAGGVILGNIFTVTVPDWLTFIGSFAGVVLTFLAGAEVDLLDQRVEDTHRVSSLQEELDNVRPDEPSSAGDQHAASHCTARSGNSEVRSRATRLRLASSARWQRSSISTTRRPNLPSATGAS